MKLEVKLAVIRFLRTAIPQIPAVLAYILEVAKTADLPAWVVPALVPLGAIATALDKFLREVGFYEDVRGYIFGK